MSPRLTITFTDRAEDDIAETWKFVAQTSIEQADRLLVRLIEQCERLTSWPGTGRPRPDLAPDARGVVAINHLILYRVESDCVVILRVIHAARDLATVVRQK
jgi:toxin ParE1/3/4